MEGFGQILTAALRRNRLVLFSNWAPAALAEMAANAYPGVAARSVDEFMSIEGLRA